MRPPTNHQSGCGCTHRLPTKTLAPSGESSSMSEHAFTRQSSASPYSLSGRRTRCDVKAPVLWCGTWDWNIEVWRNLAA